MVGRFYAVIFFVFTLFTLVLISNQLSDIQMSEVNDVIVLDIGGSAARCGYAAEDSPCCRVPAVARRCGRDVELHEAAPSESYNHEVSRSENPVHRGVVQDWDQLEQLWSICMENIGCNNPESYSFLVTESMKATASDRSKWAELMFETVRCPGLCLANSLPLSLYASGRTTGLVAECGAGLTSVAPVFEGLALSHAVFSVEYGGQDISDILRSSLETFGVHLDLQEARMLKEKYCFIDNAGKNAKDSMTTFTLPDGTDVTVKSNIFNECCDEFCVNNLFDVSGGGIVAQIQKSFDTCDEVLKREISQNIILCGGTSLLPGLGDFILDRLVLRNPADYTTSKYGNNGYFNVIPNSSYSEPGFTSQRRHAAWIGGSIIASLDTFKQIQLTKQEWEESGDAAVQSKVL